MEPAEEAVLKAALTRGFVSAAQVDEARRIADKGGATGGVLTVLTERHLTPQQREELRRLWLEVTGQEATRAEFDPGGATLHPSRDGAGFDANEATLLQPGPPQPFDASAVTVIESSATTPPSVPASYDLRSANTLVDEGAVDPHEDSIDGVATLHPGRGGPEQTEVAGRPPPRPRSPTARDLSGVEHSLRSQPGAPRTAPSKVGPERVGKFKVVRELGRGGMGVVYEARDEYLARPVALKVLLGGLSAGDMAVQRFKVEGLAAERLKHPNVVQVIEMGQDPEQGNWYMAMELIQGVSLKEKIDKGGPLDELTAIDYTMQLADALSFAHEQNVLHRDVKPPNVLLDQHGVPKLTDFGLAKLVGEHQHSVTAPGPSLMGTPGFMPPEQAGISNEAPDRRSDVYSLGATLFFMVTGRAPFHSDSVARTLMLVVDEPPPLPSSLRPGLSHDLETIILKCLEKKPADRYQDMTALRDDLQRFLDARQIVATRPGPLVRLGRWVGANRASAVGLSLGVLMCAVLVARELTREPPRPPAPDVALNGHSNGQGTHSIAPETSAEKTPATVAFVDTASLDRRSPVLRPLEPATGQAVATPSVLVKVEAHDESGEVRVVLGDDQELYPDDELGAPENVYRINWKLDPAREGQQRTTIAAIDTSGNRSEVVLLVVYDKTPPIAVVEQDPPGAEVTAERVRLALHGSEPFRLSAEWSGNLGGDQTLRPEHSLELRLPLDKAVDVAIKVVDEAGNETELHHRVRRVEHPWLRGDERWSPSPAQRAAASERLPVSITNELEMRFVLLPPGELQRPHGTVKVTRPAYLGATEVTNEQLRRFAGDHHSGAGLDDALQPAVNVSWEQAEAFCAWLTTEHPRLGPLTVRYRLPTEAEWEVAAVAFTPDEWWLPREQHVWSKDSAPPASTARIASLAPNPLGLFDVLGNVDEWCRDCFAETPPEELEDPFRSAFVDRHQGKRVARGGSWLDPASACSPAWTAARRGFAQGKGDKGVGLRVLAEVAE
jgi:formylglycine-generating enzyme required for sulfatase activity